MEPSTTSGHRSNISAYPPLPLAFTAPGLACGDRPAALQLAALLLLFVFALILLEKWSRRRSKYYQIPNRATWPRVAILSGGLRVWAAWLVVPAAGPVRGLFVPTATVSVDDPEPRRRNPGWRISGFGNPQPDSGNPTAPHCHGVIPAVMAYGLRPKQHFPVAVGGTDGVSGILPVPGAVIAVGIFNSPWPDSITPSSTAGCVPPLTYRSGGGGGGTCS